MEPDRFLVFVAKRTNLCPHKLISELSSYWLDTVTLLDSEMGLTLPGPISETPALFFDALGIVRKARNMVREEDKDKK